MNGEEHTFCSLCRFRERLRWIAIGYCIAFIVTAWESYYCWRYTLNCLSYLACITINAPDRSHSSLRKRAQCFILCLAQQSTLDQAPTRYCSVLSQCWPHHFETNSRPNTDIKEMEVSRLVRVLSEMRPSAHVHVNRCVYPIERRIGTKIAINDTWDLYRLRLELFQSHKQEKKNNRKIEYMS